MIHVHFDCNGEDWDIDLSDFTTSSCRDFVDEISRDHMEEFENRLHVPRFFINDGNVIRRTARDLLNCVKEDDNITVMCWPDTDVLGEWLFQAIMRRLRLVPVSSDDGGEDEEEIAIIDVVEEEEEEEETEIDVEQLEDVKVTVTEDEFDQVGEETDVPDCEKNCAICQELMEDGEKLKRLPCKDLFHLDCIKNWLTKSSVSCPLCRTRLRNDS